MAEAHEPHTGGTLIVFFLVFKRQTICCSPLFFFYIKKQIRNVSNDSRLASFSLYFNHCSVQKNRETKLFFTRKLIFQLMLILYMILNNKFKKSKLI